jgi:hypothetical protein
MAVKKDPLQWWDDETPQQETAREKRERAKIASEMKNFASIITDINREYKTLEQELRRKINALSDVVTAIKDSDASPDAKRKQVQRLASRHQLPMFGKGNIARLERVDTGGYRKFKNVVSRIVTDMKVVNSYISNINSYVADGNLYEIPRHIHGFSNSNLIRYDLRQALDNAGDIVKGSLQTLGRYKSMKSVADDADRILARLGFPVSVHDLPDFRWGDYRDAKIALRDAIEYWMEGGDIPHTMGSQMLTRIKRYRIRASKSVKARTALAIKKAFGRTSSKPTSTRTDPNGLRLIYSPANQAFLLFWGNPPQRETIYRQHIFQASDLPQLEDDLRGLGLKLVKKNRRLYHIVRA